MKLRITAGETPFDLEVVREGDAWIVREGKRTWRVTLDGRAPGCRSARVDDARVDFAWAGNVVSIDGRDIPVETRDSRAAMLEKAAGTAAHAAGPVTVRAPIPGLVTKVKVKAGATVKKQEPVLLLDAMKLENEIGAPRDGTIQSIEVSPGQAVDRGAPLFVIV